MSTITLPNIRVGSDLQVRVRLKDGGVAIDWSTLQNIKACIYSDAQRALAGRCSISIDAEDSTLLVCNYAANKPQYLGANRVVISVKYLGETKTYDKPAFTFVRWTDDQAGEQITIDDPDVDVEIEVEDISSSILQEAVDAAFAGAERANEAAAAAEHMVDIHTGPEGKSAYEVAVEEGYTGTEEEWLASLVGPQGPQGIQGETGEAAGFGTASAALTEDGGNPGVTVATSGSDTAKNFAFTFKNLKGDKGDKGDQGNSGYTGAAGELEVVNNLTDGGSTAALSAEMGKTLEGEVSQLEHKVDGVRYTVSDADVHQVNTSSDVDTPDGTRLRLVYNVKVGDQISGSCSIGSGVAAAIYDTLSNALVAGGAGKLQEISASYAPSVSDVASVNGFLVFSEKKIDSTAITAQEKADLLAATEILVYYPSLQKVIPFAAIASNNVVINADNSAQKFTMSGAFFIYDAGYPYAVPTQEIVYDWGTEGRLYYALVVSEDYTTVSMVEHYKIYGRHLIAFVRRANSDSQLVELLYGSTGLIFTIDGKNQLTEISDKLTEIANIYSKADANIIRVTLENPTLVDNPDGVRIRVLMPVKAGQRIWAKTTDPLGLNCGVWDTIKNALPAMATGLLQRISPGYTAGFGDTLITSNGYIGLSLTNGNTPISDQRKQEMIDALTFGVGTGFIYELFYESSLLSNRVTDLETEVAEIASPTPKEYAYFGQRIKFDNSFDFSVYASNSIAGQSSARFGDYLFIVTDRLTQVAVYNLKSKTLLYTLTTGIVSENTWHCNQSSFSDKFFSADDMFPVLYVSMQNNSAGRCEALGFRIIPTIVGGEISSFTLTQVQRIQLPVMTDLNCLGNVNLTFDTENGYMWGYGRNNNSSAANYNKAKFVKFAIPELAQSEIVLNDEDILETFGEDWSMLYAQGGFIKSGKLVIMQGYQSAGFINCRVIDLYCEKKMVTFIDLLSNGFTQEPEGVFYYGGKIMTSVNSAGIYEFTVM